MNARIARFRIDLYKPALFDVTTEDMQETSAPAVLVGDREKRVEILLAGKAQLPPLRPIFTRPAYRLDPNPDPFTFAARAFDALDRRVVGRIVAGVLIAWAVVVIVIAALHGAQHGG